MALVQKRLSLQATEVKPWDRRVYLVGTSHKAGSFSAEGEREREREKQK